MVRRVVREAILEALQRAIGEGALPECELPPIEVERPRNPRHGDYASNIALLLAKALGQSPAAVAERVAERVELTGKASVSVAAPGFINFSVDPVFAASHLSLVLAQGQGFGSSETGTGKKVLVEYVSANPNGPLTLGHGRNGVIGDVLARCFRATGWHVETEFYVNDSASSLQMRLFGESVRARYLQLLGSTVSFPEGGYKGEYVTELARGLIAKYGESLAGDDSFENVSRFQQLAAEEMRADQERDIREYGLSFDRYVSEQSLHDSSKVRAAIEQLKARGYVYEAEGAVWFRSTAFGDDKDRPLIRSNGEPTYIAADAAYHKDKYDRGYDLMIDVWGADHHGYVPRMKAVVAAMGYDPEKLVLLIYQLVRLWRGNEQVRMSTRAGELITLREVLDEVGVDAARYFFLMRSHDTALDFDLELAKKRSEENPVYYVQYAHARICSVLRHAEEQGLGSRGFDYNLLKDRTETNLILKMLELPEEVEQIVLEFAPHRLTAYSQELARLFHLFYDRCRVVDVSQPEMSRARIALCEAVGIALRNTLGLIGVSAPERMEKESGDAD